MAWPIVEYEGEEYRRAEGFTLVPVDGSRGVAIVMLKEDGGVASGVEAIAQGDPGVHSEIDTTVNLTMLEWDDPTPDSDVFTVLQPANGTDPQIVRLNKVRHKAQPGDDGASVLNPESFGTPVAGRILVVNTEEDGFEYQAQKVGDRYIPATISNSGSGEANTTLAVIAVPAQLFDWRPDIEALTVVTGTDVQVDLVARLNGETAGNVVGRCYGVASTERLTLTSAPPAGSSDTFDKVAAGVAANIYIRTELQSGAGTYTTSASTTICAVKVRPV